MDSHRSFLLGNALLAAALLVLLAMDQLWSQFGVLALIGWIALAGSGAWLLLQHRNDPGEPD